jgi:hypothetical protein
MNIRHAFRRFASLVFVVAMLAATASAALANPGDPCGIDCEAIIIVGG